jgi:hypothetical protein
VLAADILEVLDGSSRDHRNLHVISAFLTLINLSWILLTIWTTTHSVVDMMEIREVSLE